MNMALDIVYEVLPIATVKLATQDCISSFGCGKVICSSSESTGLQIYAYDNAYWYDPWYTIVP